MDSINIKLLSKAGSDLIVGLRGFRIWTSLARHDLVNQYQRTALGPFWITLSTLIMVLTFGVLYGSLMKQPISVQLPYVACGLVFWNFFQMMAITGCNVFNLNGQMIQQIPLPLSTYLYKLTTSNLLILAHNLVIIVVVLLLFVRPVVKIETLLFIPGFMILLGTSFFSAMFLAVISTRYRDTHEITQGLLRPMMFITPIIWNANLMPDRAKFVDYNLFYHLIEIVRTPLLGGAPTALNWIISIVMLFVSGGLAIFVFSRYRHRIAYWV